MISTKNAKKESMECTVCKGKLCNVARANGLKYDKMETTGSNPKEDRTGLEPIWVRNHFMQ